MSAPIVVLHSALGLTAGTRSFAADLAEATGREIATPDYYRGKVFSDTDAGIAHRDEVGPGELFARVRADLADTPPEAALVGLSLGAAFAQQLTADRPEATACVLVGFAGPVRGDWPGPPVQLHQYEVDAWVDPDAVAGLEAAVRASGASFERFVAPGEGHLSTESDLPEYDPALTASTVERIAGLLRR